MTVEIEETKDGSHTLYLPELDEHYHSVNGAIQEAQHVYIEAGLLACTKQTIKLLEIGFGTGLNAWLSWQEAKKRNLKIDYTSIEKHPLPLTLVQQLNFPVEALHQLPWEQWSELDTGFSLYKKEADWLSCELTDTYDLVYYDAFAPDKQVEMWSQALFDQISAHMNSGAILTSYCAKGEVRRRLQQAGLVVERLPGPPGKREMLRATKP